MQLPLPRHIDEQKIIEAIDYRKDVDGFHPINVGRMAIGLPCFISATPLGIVTLLKRYGIEIQRRVMGSDGNPRTAGDVLKVDDERRAIQVPRKVIDAGYTPNPRN